MSATLHFAAGQGSESIVRLILTTYGNTIDINRLDKHGRTPIDEDSGNFFVPRITSGFRQRRTPSKLGRIPVDH